MPDTIAPRAVLGVLVPYFNTVVEPELADLRPPGVSNQTARFALGPNVLEDVADAAAGLSTCGAAALLVGLSTESFPGGLDLLRQGAEMAAERSARPVHTATFATHAALRALAVRRVAVVTPFDAEANVNVRTAFETSGFDVLAIDGLACPDLATIGRTTTDDVRRAFRSANRPEAEAMVQVGTGLPVVHLIDELERELGKPVVACNAALYWQALRETGIDDRLHGFGRLLGSH